MKMDQEILKKYLAGDADPAEKTKVAAWAKANESNMAELRAYRRLYDIALWTDSDAGKREMKAKKRAFYQIASIAAMFALLIGSVCYTVYLKCQIPATVMQTIHVPAGQHVEVLLADGTNVWLNAGSTFVFPGHFSSGERTVTLDGEGYFNVRKNEGKPFVVKTPSHDVKALGTEFNVLAYGKSRLFEVSLVKGVVEVGIADRQIRLEPHTRLRQADNRLIKDSKLDFNALLWKDGLICFDDEPVEKMIDKLELYFDVRIVVEIKSFMKKKYTGKFRTKDGVEHILKVFQLKDKFTYRKGDETNVITSNRFINIQNG
jgi:ferric-dicitrate binding protein FerR (iron transport regulator)